MKRYVTILLLWVSFGVALQAQTRFGKLTIGGGVSMQFTDYTLINIAPQVGYNVTNKINVGVGLTYSYFSEKYDDDRYKRTNDYFGFNMYAKYYPLSFAVLTIQPEVSRMWKTVETLNNGAKSTSDKLVPTCLVGAGLRMGQVTAMLKYDLAQNSNSPYGNKLFYSVGYTFSF